MVTQTEVSHLIPDVQSNQSSGDNSENGRNSALVARSTSGYCQAALFGGAYRFLAAALSRENEREAVGCETGRQACFDTIREFYT
jgi:hypothetical protein